MTSVSLAEEFGDVGLSGDEFELLFCVRLPFVYALHSFVPDPFPSHHSFVFLKSGTTYALFPLYCA